MRQYLTILVILINIYACRSTEQSYMASSAQLSNIPGCDAQTLNSAEKSSCSNKDAPYLCIMELRSPLKPTKKLAEFFAWESNPCKARQSISKQLCKAKLNEKTYPGRLVCKPTSASTLKYCPPPLSKGCGMSTLKTQCFVDTYNDDDLIPSIEISGSNECEARYKVDTEACKKNLDPSLLENITCFPLNITDHINYKERSVDHN